MSSGVNQEFVAHGSSKVVWTRDRHTPERTRRAWGGLTAVSKSRHSVASGAQSSTHGLGKGPLYNAGVLTRRKLCLKTVVRTK